MIELAKEIFKPLISICLMKHKNKQGGKTRKNKQMRLLKLKNIVLE